MNTTYQVKWKRIFRSLTIFVMLAVLIPLMAVFAMRLLKVGWSDTFSDTPPTLFIISAVAIPIGAALFALPIALYFKFAAITITDDQLMGRNFWGLKNRIPLADIKAIGRFSNNGINAIIVSSRSHGEVYIYEHTECIDDIVALLTTYIQANNPERQTSG